MEWPPPIAGLYRKFALINTHLTFLAAYSPHTIPTFDHISKLNDDISRVDLQIFKDVLPTGHVNFQYVDENQLLLGERVSFTRDNRYKQNQPRSVDDAYEAVTRNNAAKPERQLLVFEFCDVRTHSIGSKIKRGGTKRQKPDFFTTSSSISLDQLSLQQLQGIIASRNATFTERINDFLAGFSENDISDHVPFKKLVENAVPAIPEPPHLIDTEELLSETAIRVDSTSEKPSAEAMAAALRDDVIYKNQISTDVTLTAPRDPVFLHVTSDLIHPDLRDALIAYKGIDVENGLYIHQTQALIAVMEEGSHVIVSTSTSSGKSLIYQIPVLTAILDAIDSGANKNCRSVTAMFIFPTKALAQDQKRHLNDLIAHLPPRNRKIIVDTYDGDTPAKDRSFIRNYADIIFTNPDAIHAAILPNHAHETSETRGWSEFLRNLRFVVIDELHVYKGTFGVHVSYVMARLNRVRALMGLGGATMINAMLSDVMSGDANANVDSTAANATSTAANADSTAVNVTSTAANVTSTAANASKDLPAANEASLQQPTASLASPLTSPPTAPSIASQLPPPTYISCLATIHNPELHFRTICAIPTTDTIVHVNQDGSPAAEKKLLVWDPPILMNKHGQRELPQLKLKSATQAIQLQSPYLPRESPVSELAKILIHLLCRFPGIKAILFCPIREVCELVIKEIRHLIASNEYPFWKSISEHDVMAYRGGYSKNDRRAIEQRMFSGRLRAIVATNALELGIDLSDLDVVICCGFPSSKSNLHQQFGRAGRSARSNGSLAVLVCGNNPLDRYFLANPHEIVDTNTYEDLCVEGILDGSSNQVVLSMHLQCAAFEWPISLEADERWFSPHGHAKMSKAFRTLCANKLHRDNRGFFRTDPRYLPWPPEKVSLRAVDDDMFAVVDITNNRNMVIEEVEAVRTSFTLYEGGIFLHQGLPYLVKEFNFSERYAKVERVNVSWSTRQRDFTDVDPYEIELVKKLMTSENSSDIPVLFGKILSTIIVFGYFKVDRKGQILDAVEVKNPPIKLHSKGFWIDIPNSAIAAIKEKSLSPAGGIHAAQHAIMNTLPLFITGGATTNPNARWSSAIGDVELSTECKAPEKEFASRQTARKRPARLIFHDSKGGSQGTGIAAKTFEFIDDIIKITYQRVSKCECVWGCPLCVTGSFCSENMLVMSKPAAEIILGALLGMDLDFLKSSVVDGPEGNMPEISTETVISDSQHVRFSRDVEVVPEKRRNRTTEGQP